MSALALLGLLTALAAPAPVSPPAQLTQFTETQRVFAGDGVASDRFGQSIDIEHDLMVVGAYGRDDVDPSNGFCTSGAAYVFERQNGDWVETAKLTASDAHCRAWFGFTVATDGESIAVGAYENDNATTLGSAGCNGGAVYVYTRSGSTWVEEQRVVPTQWACGLQFGKALAIEGETLAVGAPTEAASSGRGAAYLFQRTGSTWVQTQRFERSTTDGIGAFGEAVDLDRNTLAVGAPSAGSPVLGEVHLFRRDSGGAWSLSQVIGPTGGLNYGFGSELALTEDSLAVSLPGANAPRNSVHLYERIGGVWSFTRAFLGPSRSSDTTTYYGWDLDFDGDTLVVGDKAADDASPGSQTCYSGAVWMYQRTGPAPVVDWREYYTVTANPTCNDYFGDGVALDGDRLVLGGDLAPGAASDTGAVAIFERPGAGDTICLGTACGCGNEDPRGGCANSTGRGAILRGTGRRNLSGGQLRLRATHLPEGAFGLFIVGMERSATSYGDGALCVADPAFRYAGQLARAGESATLVLENPLPAAGSTVMVGVPAIFQCMYRDFQGAACGTGFNATNALSITPF